MKTMTPMIAAKKMAGKVDSMCAAVAAGAEDDRNCRRAGFGGESGW
jgi:hypothetical protein